MENVDMITDQTNSSIVGTVPSPNPLPEGEGFSLSPSAISRIAKLLVDEPIGSYLRISVLGGGCSGFQYNFAFDNAPLAEDDVAIANAVVDSTSLELMQNAMLDYVEHLGGSAFEIKNPQAVAGCGCGNSFSV